MYFLHVLVRKSILSTDLIVFLRNPTLQMNIGSPADVHLRSSAAPPGVIFACFFKKSSGRGKPLDRLVHRRRKADLVCPVASWSAPLIRGHFREATRVVKHPWNHQQRSYVRLVDASEGVLGVAGSLAAWVRGLGGTASRRLSHGGWARARGGDVWGEPRPSVLKFWGRCSVMEASCVCLTCFLFVGTT